MVITCKYHGWTSARQFLNRMPSLEAWDLISASGLEPGRTFCSFRLRQLSTPLHDCHAEVWRSLRTPYLARLKLVAGDGTELVLEELCSMLLRSKSVLQELLLIHISAHNAIYFISAHPSVMDLTVTSSYEEVSYEQFPGDLLPCLTISKDKNKPIFMPNLQSLNIVIHMLSPYGDRWLLGRLARDVVKMVQSRANADSLPPGMPVLREFSLRLGLNDEVIFDHIRTSLAPLVTSRLQLWLND
ncbi:hypothetical protein GYMLUDRAFT_970396 [Collybiopsis luxurians FD-317 M1]|uniref:Uncharacterized protein n=1 Tax=Collybiopsis luxurians FD-317 M1 TaxID=944289 RepID=A0A0D0APT2_9AGAR|nr:hypothetical protein GYMLUDRAFT_970396 [Collybiopsis luxurians FD-317 M1]